MKNLLLISAISISALGLYSSQATKEGTVRLTQKENEIYTKPNLKQYLKNTKNPSLILRIPSTINSVTANTSYSGNSIYNTMEKQFSLAGFVVRDRALYEKVIENKNNSGYGDINDKTNTDLIIELVNLEPYNINTNKYYSGSKEKVLNQNITYKGYKAEFKIIKVRDNEVAGLYTFYFTPCTDNSCTISVKNGLITDPKTRAVFMANVPYETTTGDSWAEFAKLVSNKLINEMTQ
jgi:hypothetical protein